MKKVSLVVLLLLATAIAIASGIYANTSMELGIVSLREGGYGYSAGTKNVWKIVEYQSGKYNYDNAIYCLRGGAGFGSNSYIENRTYNVSYNLKEYSSIPATVKAVLPSDTAQTYKKGEQTYTYTNYNAVLVLLDNLYLPKDKNAQSFKQNMIATAFPTLDSEDFVLTDDDIEVVQQIALWYFTNADKNNAGQYTYHFETLPALQLTQTEGGQGPFNLTLDDLDDTWERQNQASQLYNFLIDSAKTYASAYGNADVREVDMVPVEVDNSNVLGEVASGEIITGPFSLKEVAITNYNILADVKDQNDNNLTYTLLNKNKQPVPAGTTLKDLAKSGEDFYISVNENINISKVKVNIKVQYESTTTTFYTVGGLELIEQPVVIVDRIQKEESKLIETPIVRKAFDLSLRKFITKINGVAPTVDRSPVVDTTKLANGTDTTATYTHPKNPLQVNIGDTVLYTIRVYNEGEIDGKATEITDHLPAGLTLKQGSTINSTYGWIQDGKVIKTIYLANQPAIPAFDKTKAISYLDVQVECTVTAEASTSEQTIRNIAEITADADKDGAEVTDRDSTPNNVDTNNYNPPADNSKYQEDDDDYEPLILPGKAFDLHLRKFITKINGVAPTVDRTPVVDTTKLANGTDTTATYTHPKNPLQVNIGDTVLYTIRVYNEGEIDGKATEITDHLPAGLVLKQGSTINGTYGWTQSGQTIKTTYLASQPAIPAFDKTKAISYVDVQVECTVTAEASTENQSLRNIAEITADADKDGAEVTDRDSTPNNVDTNNYNPPADNSKYQEDDDDYEPLILPGKEFDLSLRKFITKVDDDDITTRIPIPVIGKGGIITYEHPKDVVRVNNGSIVIYTIRIYNEGQQDGYAKEIKDILPAELDFLPDHEINKQYMWTVSEDDSKVITTQYLSKENGEDNLIKAFDSTTMTSPDYKDVKVACKVNLPDDSNKVLINTAEIKDDSDKNGNEVTDKDSTPDNGVTPEDDIDTERVQIVIFDLALRKFITNVNGVEDLDRIPKFTIENGKYVYNHPKDPVIVKNNDIVTYTIRIFNEGNIAGFAEEIKDDVPAGLVFLPDNEINKQYRWKLNEDGSISTDYLSKAQNEQNKIQPFDKSALAPPATTGTPSYKDVKVAFRVNESTMPENRTIINTAEIAKDKNDYNVPDKDSTPNNGAPEEDDIDKEYLKVKYFDLALLKWVSRAYVTVDGKTTTVQGNSGSSKPNQDPVIKIDLDRKKLSKTSIKYVYTIMVMNQGEIAGYATEIRETIPEGLEFVAKDNPKWYINEKGEVVTDQLKDTLLQPGESVSIEVTLRWINSETNFGLKTNVAQISADKNDSNTPDKDSTPNNNIPSEDDQDEAPVIIAIKTGTKPIMYMGIITASIAILGGGIYLIRRYVI